MSNPRAEYSPIFQRKPLKLPGNARLAVFTVVNVEEWDINAQMARSVIPAPQELSGSTTLELSDGGGHVGFIGGASPAEADYWLERRIPKFLAGLVPA